MSAWDPMASNKDFAILVGRAFLQEIEAGHVDSAIAFGRAFLLSLGMKGPDPERNDRLAHTRSHGDALVSAAN